MKTSITITCSESISRVRCISFKKLPILLVLLILRGAQLNAQELPARPQDPITIHGTVSDTEGKPVADATVHLRRKDGSEPAPQEQKTDADGKFVFFASQPVTYMLTAEKAELQSHVLVVSATAGNLDTIRLILEKPGLVSSATAVQSSPPAISMEFTDQPDFVVAGISDWTAAGGHGSDSSLRTSEALTRETVALRPATPATAVANNDGHAGPSEAGLMAAVAANPDSFAANLELGAFYLDAGDYQKAIPLLTAAHRIDPANYSSSYDLALACEGIGDFIQAREDVNALLAHQDRAELHRLSGELNEKLDDALAAVREFEQAAREDPSEQNYFEWGSELLLHRAVWQAQEVFQKGADAHPGSGRMLTGLGTALFAGARYDESARRLCEASDLSPTDVQPYVFMNKVEMAAPNPLPCIKLDLARFVHEQPASPLANYFYAMASLKEQHGSADSPSTRQAEAMLRRAVAIDNGYADAWLQLGILSSSRHEYHDAIRFYTRAIDADSQLSEAYYRLGLAYDRTGDTVRAQSEFKLHDEIEKKQAQDVERERREIKQFLVVQQASHSSPPLQ